MRITLKIELIDADKPKVWRQIKVSPDITFHQLHLSIQAAFGWRNSHLYQFSENGFRSLLTITSPHDQEGGLNATDVIVGSILINMYNQSSFNPDAAAKLIYIYDFGDSWEHKITAIDLDRTANVKPELVDGEGACPPEDCGGPHAYADVKKCLQTGKPSELTGEPWEPWLEECGYPRFDPNKFDKKAAAQRMKMLG